MLEVELRELLNKHLGGVVTGLVAGFLATATLFQYFKVEPRDFQIERLEKENASLIQKTRPDTVFLDTQPRIDTVEIPASPSYDTIHVYDLSSTRVDYFGRLNGLSEPEDGPNNRIARYILDVAVSYNKEEAESRLTILRAKRHLRELSESECSYAFSELPERTLFFVKAVDLVDLTIGQGRHSDSLRVSKFKSTENSIEIHKIKNQEVVVVGFVTQESAYTFIDALFASSPQRIQLRDRAYKNSTSLISVPIDWISKVEHLAWSSEVTALNIWVP